MNKSITIGRITADPVLRHTQTGVPILGFTLAVNRKYKNAEGQTDVDFINYVAFKNTAEIINKYVKKGDLLGVIGSIQTRNYDNSNGQKVYVTEIVVDEIHFLQSKRAEVSKEEEPVETNAFEDFGMNIEIDESELPF